MSRVLITSVFDPMDVTSPFLRSTKSRWPLSGDHQAAPLGPHCHGHAQQPWGEGAAQRYCFETEFAAALDKRMPHAL
jgi:hypothetical protein